MASTRIFTRSFGGGEVSPHLFGRIDDARAQQGLALCENMVTRPTGPAYKRPGTQFVRRAKYADRDFVLIPFTYSTGDTLAIELGHEYARFHTQGGTVLYIEGMLVESVDDTLNQITFYSDHGLGTDELIRFLPGDGGTLPTGTTATGYFTRLVDARTIEISLTSGGAAVNITSTGTAPFYCYRLADQPATYISSRAFSTSSTVSDDITTSGAHNLTNGDPITFTLSGGTLPTYLEDGVTYSLLPGVVYYANVTAASIFRVSKTRADALANVYLNFNAVAVVAGGPIVHYHYTVGQYVTHSTPDGYFRCIQDGPQLNVPGTTTYWQQMPADGVLEVPLPYQEADLPDVNFAQSGDTMTLVHPEYWPAELTRLSESNWSYYDIEWLSPIDAPLSPSVTPVAGLTHDVTNVSVASPAIITTATEHKLQINEQVYVSSGVGDIAAGFYAIATTPAVDTMTLKNIASGTAVGSGAATATGTIRYASQRTEATEFYRITAVNEKGDESDGSGAAGASNTLSTSGAYNTVSWQAVTGAVRYRVYKAYKGLYGYIGQTEGTSFKDDDIAPDMGVTLPKFDSAITNERFRAVSYFEGRRFFGGADADPQGIVASRSGDPDSFTYSFPPADDNRIRRSIDSQEACTIRHLVAMPNLIALTDSTEFRVTSTNGGPLTGDDFTVRPQTYNGCSTVRPIVVNGVVVFVEARGGHVREFGYRSDQGYSSGDLSMRAAHLFDGYDLTGSARQRVPFSMLWWPRSDGALMGLTYAPEEGVGGWHRHTTDGEFFTCCSVADGTQDTLYLGVRRTIDGTEARCVEFLTPHTQPSDRSEWRYVDACTTFRGVHTGGVTITVTRATNWSAGSSVTITSGSLMIFRTGTADVGDYVRAVTGGVAYRLNITAVTNGTTATASIVDAIPLATATTNFATATWGWMRSDISGLDHHEGLTVPVLVDGVATTKTVTDGAIALTAPGYVVHVGRSYTAKGQTLPAYFPADGYGTGRTKNVTNAHLRCWKSMPFEVGTGYEEPDEYDWVDVVCDPSKTSQVVDVTQYNDWNEDGQLWVRQADPYPLTLVSLTAKVTIGS